MGLDVYLYRYDDKPATEAAEAEYNRLTEHLWENANTEEEKTAVVSKQKEIASTLGLSDWGDDEKRKHKIEKDSEKHAEHYFKIGYFRSSYNGGGINRILRDSIGADLSDICGNNGDDYCFQPDWSAMKARALEARQKLLDFNAAGGLRVEEVSPNMFMSSPTITSAKAALELVLSERAKPRMGGFESYSSRDGTFLFGEPMQAVALIPGVHEMLGRATPCTYIAYKSDLSWYADALEIVADTADFVLSQPDPQKYWLHWSG